MKRRQGKASKTVLEQATETGRMVAEMPAATFTTLSHRVPLLLAGALDPQVRAHPENTRMVVEKVDAGAESAGELSQGAAAIASAMARYASKQARMNAALAVGMFSGQPARALRDFVNHGKITVDLATSLGFEVSEIAAKTARASVRPSHKRVTENARRLASG